uniref:DC1 domain-containing protein n=1 Tax=Opuntia streptacantha TaxID=393608 RepID=A0A7C9CSI7_OPUST
MSEEKWIHHCSHTQHQLKEVYSNTEFKCQVCNHEGEGTRYRCNPCDFAVHTICGTLPDCLSSFTHPEHQLSLRPKPFLIHKCRLCGDFVTGMVYRCEAAGCKFFLHPMCSQSPELLENHPCHPPHPLRLCSSASKKCDVCQEKCKHWRYHCDICDVHIHLPCLARKTTASNAATGATAASKGSDKAKFWTYIGRLADIAQLMGDNLN